MTPHPIACALVLSITAAAAAAPHPSLPAAGSPDGFGVNIHFTDPQPGELAMIRDAGFRWVRMDLTWAGTERKPGEYDFSAYDRLVAALERHGLRALFILDYGNPHYADPGDRHPLTSRAGTAGFRAAYARWAAAAVTRYAGKRFLWEIWNEPNIEGFWKPRPNAADYAALASAACTAIHHAAPAEALLGPATSTVDLAFLEACFRAGLLDHWCAVSVHPYRQQPPATAADDYRKLRALIDRFAPAGKTIPIVSGEWGYSSAWPSLGPDEPAREHRQAEFLTEMLRTHIAHDIPLSIWYDWRDDGDDPREAEHRFGLVRRPFHPDAPQPFEPKPAYHAARNLLASLRAKPAE